MNNLRLNAAESLGRPETTLSDNPACFPPTSAACESLHPAAPSFMRPYSQAFEQRQEVGILLPQIRLHPWRRQPGIQHPSDLDSSQICACYF